MSSFLRFLPTPAAIALEEILGDDRIRSLIPWSANALLSADDSMA